MNGFSILILILLLGSGGYAVYLWIRLRREWYLIDNKFLLPGNCTAADCKDPDGFLEYISPKLLIFGIALIVFGLLYLPGFFNAPMPALLADILNIAMPVLGFGIFVCFIILQAKAAKLFW